MQSSRQRKTGGQASSAPAQKDGAAAKPVSNLLMRVITGVIAGLFTLFITGCGGTAFCIFCLCVGAVVLYEWNGIIAAAQRTRACFCAWIFFLLLGGALLAEAAPLYVFALLAAGACLCYGVARAECGGKMAVFPAAGFIYAALFPVGFVFLRAGLTQGDRIGLCWAEFLYVAVWASDVGAYICGRICGGAKLAPKISPNKTWSGAVGGAVFAVLAAACFTFLVRQEAILGEGTAVMAGFIPFFLIVAIAFLLSIIAQAGDLAESWFKRRFGVKDSGRLLPGHGGIMDRVDGLLPACIALLCLLAVTGLGFP